MTTQALDPAVLGGLSDRLGEATVAKLVALFRENVADRRSQAKIAFESGDARRLEVAFHSIKGSAQLVGARELEEVAARWEERARGSALDSIEEALSELDRAFARVVEKLEGAA